MGKVAAVWDGLAGYWESMDLIPIILAAFLVVVPVVLAVQVVRTRYRTRLDWLLAAVTAATFGGYTLLVGRWDLFSYYLRPLVALLLLLALVVSLVRNRRTPWRERPDNRRGWLPLGTSVLVAALFTALAGYAASGVVAGRAAVDLAFPLRDGVAYVGQGGANPLLNYHNPNRAQAYALDIVGLNAAGLRAWGLAPAEPERYAVFGRAVHSPCAGTVAEARDGLADQSPPTTDRVNLAGNHVIVRCRGTDPAVDVLLAHLSTGSVAVRAGADVAVGDLIGRVGNTGNTTEPHLHVHAVRADSGSALDGDGVPIRFGGRFLVRNDLVFAG
nr:M23 family metallopeptidase [Propionicimonas sp.]